MINNPDYYTACRKLALKSSGFAMSFFTTVLRGEVICFTYNNLAKEILNVFCVQELKPDDVETLEKIVFDFFDGNRVDT